ncbi:AAA family ATPase [Limibaculum sp. FT325]|uniref:AAA family ATPase n=1 Tax=Thermohalobaculum sediminis TaxID=2939436 RepID=UPI0020BE662C|nr:AAA family ATPase [Limibaculum sediminis]MCL5776336.1 AAA family ATPase [Limibaculum sediminis]
MRLRALRLWNVRRFAGRGVAIEGIADGVNVLAAPNEAGKSTAFDALHALFFAAHGSTAQAVRDLRPYSGGSPLVEAEIDLGPSSFRVSKQFSRGAFARVTDLASGRLIAQADEAEAFISGLVSGGAAAPAGLLWVRQGVTAMGGGTNAERAEERRARQDVLASVAGGEVEALTGGRRMIRAAERCAAALTELATATGRPRAGGPWAEAIAEVERLTAEEKRLGDDIATLRRDLEDRRHARTRLAALDDAEARAAREAAARTTARAFEAARAHAERLRAAESAETLAAERARAASVSAAEFERAATRATALSATLREAETRRAETAITRAAAAAADAEAAAALRVAEEAAAAARARLDDARRAARAAEAQARLAELRTRLERAEAARRRGEEAAAEARGLSVPESAFTSLDALERRIAGLEAARAAAAVHLAATYLPGAEGRVRIDGAPLVAGAVHALSGTATIELDGIGRLTLTPGHAAGAEDADAALAAAEAERQAMLGRVGAASLAELRARAARAADALSAAGGARAELDALAPEGLDALRLAIGELERLAARAGEADAPSPDPEQAEAALAEAEAALRAARSARESARSRHDTAKEADMAAAHELARAEEALAALDATLGPADERPARLAALAADATQTAEALASARAAVEALRADAPDLASAEAAAARAASALSRAREEAEMLEREIAGLTGRITARAEEGIEERHEETVGRLSAARGRLGHFEAEVAALTRLGRALDEARAEAREQYFGPVMAELRPLLAMLLDEAAVSFDDATLLPGTLARDGQDEEVAALSGGTREQLAVLTRLAFARLLAKGGQPVPVILDDALVYSDDARIERMFDVLHRQARDLQILVLTCRARAFERLGGRGLGMADWRPEG